MNINATFVGQLVFVLAITCAAIGYFLGRRKSSSPVLLAVVGFACGLIPPLGPIFILVLALKKDLPATPNQATTSSDV